MKTAELMSIKKKSSDFMKKIIIKIPIYSKFHQLQYYLEGMKIKKEIN